MAMTVAEQNDFATQAPRQYSMQCNEKNEKCVLRQNLIKYFDVLNSCG